jgi:hypothetical protein
MRNAHSGDSWPFEPMSDGCRRLSGRKLVRSSLSHIRGLLKGPKFNGRHSTVISSAVPAVEAARDCPHVTKIALGIITPIRAAQEHLKFTPSSGGLKMQVRGTNAIQMFWLYTTRPDEAIEEITRKWDTR